MRIGSPLKVAHCVQAESQLPQPMISHALPKGVYEKAGGTPEPQNQNRSSSIAP